MKVESRSLAEEAASSPVIRVGGADFVAEFSQVVDAPIDGDPGEPDCPRLCPPDASESARGSLLELPAGQCPKRALICRAETQGIVGVIEFLRALTGVTQKGPIMRKSRQPWRLPGAEVVVTRGDDRAGDPD